MRAWCPGLMHVPRPGGRVAVCGSCRRAVLFAASVVLLACVNGLPLLACACAFYGFLLWFLLLLFSPTNPSLVTHA